MQADIKYRSWEWWSILSQHSRGGSKCISALRPGQATKYVPSQPELHLKNKKENKQRKKKVRKEQKKERRKGEREGGEEREREREREREGEGEGEREKSATRKIQCFFL